jgi:hypothetical protein
VLRETTSRGLSGLVCPSRTSERGGEGHCVKEGGGGEGERQKERALWLPLCHNPDIKVLLFSDWRKAARLKRRNASVW